MSALPVLERIEEIRIGSLEDPDVGFTEIGAMSVSPTGEVYVAESSLRELRVYDSDGHLLRSYGRDGDAPGEFRALSEFGIVGDTVWISDSSRNRLTLFSRDGDLLGTVSGRVEVPLGESRGRQQTLAIFPRELQPGGRIIGRAAGGLRPNLPNSVVRAPVVQFSSSGSVIDTISFDSVRVGYEAREISAVGPLGAVTLFVRVPPFKVDSGSYVLDTAQETVIVHWWVDGSSDSGILEATRLAQAGDTIYQTRLRYEAQPVDPAYLDSVAAARVRGMRLPPAESVRVAAAARSALEMPPHHPPVRFVELGSDGSVWMLLDQAGAISNRWVVLTGNGQPWGTLDLEPGVELRRRDEANVWLVERDDFDVPWLVRYRLRRPAQAETRTN